jgi:hypothetical protein
VRNYLQLSSAYFISRAFPYSFEVVCAPDLHAARSRETLLLSWPEEDSDYALEVADSIGAPNGWRELATEPVVIGQRMVVALPANAKQGLFRVRK